MSRTGGYPSRPVYGIALAALVALVLAVPAVPAGAKQTPPGDPPGNNGTIKVAASDPPEPDPNNQPHVDGCVIWLEFFGFDQGQTANIVFTAQAPSGTGQELLRDENVAISDDPAGGGQDDDEVISYDLASYLSGLNPQPQQGYHIKVRSDSLQAPGGYKSKVFWINCSPAPPASLAITKAVEGQGTGPFGFAVRCNHHPLDRAFTLNAGETHEVADVPAGATCIVTETDKKGAAETRVSESPSDNAADGQVKAASGSRAALTFTNVFGGAGPAQAAGTTTPGAAPGAAPGVEVAGAQETRSPAAAPFLTDQLPRTGGGQAALAGLGLWALSAGALALLCGRRRER